MACDIGKLYIFHDWDKWVEYIQHYTSRYEVLGRPTDFPGKYIIIQYRQKRICKRCGFIEDVPIPKKYVQN